MLSTINSPDTNWQGRIHLESAVLANTVSMVPFEPDAPEKPPVWLTNAQLLKAGVGARKELAHLLTAFLLGRGINCYVVVGAGFDGVDCWQYLSCDCYMPVVHSLVLKIVGFASQMQCSCTLSI